MMHRVNFLGIFAAIIVIFTIFSAGAAFAEQQAEIGATGHDRDMGIQPSEQAPDLSPGPCDTRGGQMFPGRSTGSPQSGKQCALDIR